MDPITIMLILAIVGSLAAGGTGVASALINKNAQEETNQANIQMQKEVNAQNQYNIEHAHQIEMADLKAAGLNPVLTATGGSGAPIQSLNSPRAVAPQLDLSGVSSAMSGLSHMATMAMMMDMKESIAQERNNTLTAIAKGHDATSAANAVLRNNTLDRLYQRKAATLATEGRANVHSARQWDELSKKYSKKQIEEMRRILSYNWIKK